MLPEVGTFIAKAVERNIYENDKGTLVFAANMEIDANTSIIDYQSLTTSDGALNTKTIDRLKKVYGWDGLDPYWLVDTAELAQVEVEIVIEDQVSKTDGKTYKKVKWINKPGETGGKEVPQGDKGSILSKYGAKFRALAGGSAQQSRVAPAATAKKPAAPPPPAPKKAVPPPPPAKKAKKPATMQEAWELFCQTADGKIREEDINGEWYNCIRKTVNKEQHDCDENDWGIIVEEMPEYFNQLKF